ncbi:MAG: carbohydrate ABC transporter permease [Clostridia bacterium]
MRNKGIRNSKLLENSKSDLVFDVVNNCMLVFLLLIILYPLIVVVSSSFSSPSALMAGKVFFFPIEPTLDGYKAVFTHRDIWMGLGNSVFYTLVGTTVNMIVTTFAAYPLSRKDFTSRTWISLFFAFTMWFGGGLIPTYMLIKNLGLYNTRSAMIVPLMMNIWNMIIVRTYFQSNIGDELLESAKLDGCSDFKFFLRIALPLSKPVLAVVCLYYAVENWNIFSHAYIYLAKQEYQPIQVVLRDILILNTTQELSVNITEQAKSEAMSELLKYSLVVVASLPMLIIYPFVQKFFVKGMMVGSVKG